MTKPKILVLTSSSSELNTNLLKLAFSPWNHETRFSRASELMEETKIKKNDLEEIKWVVIDEGEAEQEKLEELQTLLKDHLPQASGLFLTGRSSGIESFNHASNFFFVKKPFAPGELKKFFT